VTQPIIWSYDQSDPALMLWTAALEAWQMHLPPDAQVLELGCAETDFLERLQAQNPGYQVTGVDCFQQPRAHVIAGDACDPTLFERGTFDAIILLGALEHFGLGFYGDPIHADPMTGEPIGDVLAMQNIARWLKPGGWVYFDVPCNPMGRIMANRHFRIYSPSEVYERLIEEPGYHAIARFDVRRGYSWPEPNAGTWCPEPNRELVPYWFVAVLAEKS
jgi:SAM-dependent methyltransferase